MAEEPPKELGLLKIMEREPTDTESKDSVNWLQRRPQPRAARYSLPPEASLERHDIWACRDGMIRWFRNVPLARSLVILFGVPTNLTS